MRQLRPGQLESSQVVHDAGAAIEQHPARSDPQEIAGADAGCIRGGRTGTNNDQFQSSLPASAGPGSVAAAQFGLEGAPIVSAGSDPVLYSLSKHARDRERADFVPTLGGEIIRGFLVRIVCSYGHQLTAA